MPRLNYAKTKALNQGREAYYSAMADKAAIERQSEQYRIISVQCPKCARKWKQRSPDGNWHFKCLRCHTGF